MAILFAILLNEVRSRLAKKTIQTISYLPHFLSWIIVTGILHDALSANGIINELLVKAHIISSPISFFSVPELFWPIVAFGRRPAGMPLFIWRRLLLLIPVCMRQRQLTVREDGQK